MTYGPKPAVGAVERDCPRCGLPTLHQAGGLPFVVTADAARLTAGQAAELTGPNRLAWCLREGRFAGARLVEVLPVFHSPVCVWAHVVDHCCPDGTPPGRRPEGALW